MAHIARREAAYSRTFPNALLITEGAAELRSALNL